MTEDTPEVADMGSVGNGKEIGDENNEVFDIGNVDNEIEDENIENDKNENDEVTENDKKLICCVCGEEENVKRCGGCKAAHYCSKDCQNSHWEYHSLYCQAIVDLEHLERCKLYGTKTVRQPSGLTGRTKRRMVDLVGEKPKIQCWFDDEKAEMLWDTGSQVTLVDRPWLNERYPQKEILPVSQFLDGKYKHFKLSAANSSEIKYDGVVLMDFGLKHGKVAFDVPVLVSSDPIAECILGYNVIIW